jgi:hypothetical protein
MTLSEFLATEKRLSVDQGARILRIDEDVFEGDTELFVFDGDTFLSRCPLGFHLLIGTDSFLSKDKDALATRLYFDHYVWECVDHTLENLTSFYGEWLRWQGLEEACALEHIAGSDLTYYQLQWLTDFVDLWDQVVK